MNVVIPEENEYIKITSLKINVRCKECNHTWGVYLQDKSILPEGWHVCVKCASKQFNVLSNKENNSNERVRVIK